MSFYDDITVGEIYAIGHHTFGAGEIKTFAGRFDPQLFHIDEDVAARSHFGALCASGWHTGVMCMRLMVDHRRNLDDQARARGERTATVGPALGFRDLKWLKPVYVGDTIDYKIEVVEKRVSARRPGFGLMTMRSTGVNQKGEMVISFVATPFVERRPERP